MQRFEIEKCTFFHELKSFPFIDKILLFGSRARSDVRKRSDIDLAIVCPAADESDWNRVKNVVEKADTLLEIDCIRFDAIKDQKFKDEILKKHIVLFDRGKK